MSSSDSNGNFGGSGEFGDSRERLAAIHAAARQAAGGPRTGRTPAAPPALSAWERWEMGTIDGSPRASMSTPAARRNAERRNTAPPPSPPPAPKVDLADLARIRREARMDGEAEGRAAGLAEGRKVGHTEGLATGLAAATAHAERLRALARSLPDALRRAEEELSQTVLALALDVARQVVHRTLKA